MLFTCVICAVLAGQALAVVVRTEIDARGNAKSFFSSDGANTAESILATVQQLAKSHARVDKPKIETIQELADQLETALVETHRNAVHEVDINLKAIEKCNDNQAAMIRDITAGTKKKVDKERQAHATCREQEIEKHEDMVKKCSHLREWLKALDSPEKTGSSDDEMVDWVVKMDSYWCPKGEKAKELSKSCKKATADHKAHKAECDPLQSQFELGFCTWRVELIDTCKAQTTCYDAALKAYLDHKTETEQLIIQWKTEYVALKKISCYVNVWLKDSNANTVDDEQLTVCQDLQPDKTKMDIDFKKPADKTECSLEEVAKYPGTDEFKETEYKAFINVAHNGNDMDKYHFITEPTACVGDETTAAPTSTAVTTTAPPMVAPRIEQAAVRFAGWEGGIKCQWVLFQKKFSKTPFVQVSVDHRTHAAEWDHDATTVWMQEVYNDRFKVCVRELAQYGTGGHDDNLHVSYMAFEGAPQGAVLGNSSWPAWDKNENVKCQWMEYGQTLKDARIVTTIYHQPKYGGNALTEWIQEIEPTRFRACMRETAHHDQWHMASHMAFMAWTQAMPGMLDGREEFASWSGGQGAHGKSCKNIKFSKSFTSAPVVQATVNHFYHPKVTHDALSLWMEKVTTDGFRVCLQELAQYGSGGHAKLYIDWIARSEE